MYYESFQPAGVLLELYLYLAGAYEALGDYDSAAVWEEKIIEELPADPRGTSVEILVPYVRKMIECYKQGRPYYAVYPDGEEITEK